MESTVLNSESYITKADYYKKLILKNQNIIIGDSRSINLSLKKSNVVNLSIGGETINTLCKRIGNYNFDDSIFVVVGVGINDVMFLSSKDDIIMNYHKLLNTIDSKTHNSEIWICEILPINISGVFFNKKATNCLVNELNFFLNAMKFKSCNSNKFSIISFDFFKNKKSELINKYTNDGVHLDSLGIVIYDSILNNQIY
jgi:lysophospholipase L1-like esterase